MTTCLHYLTIHVDSVAQTAEWYRRVFNLPVRYLAPDGTYCELDTGVGLTLCFSANAWVRQSFPQFRLNSFLEDAPGFHLAFATDDVFASYNLALEYGAIGLSPPERRPWGRVEASLRDLNGILLNITAHYSLVDGNTCLST